MASVLKEKPRLAVRWRPFTSVDLETIAFLEGQIHAAPWTEGNFRDSIAAGHYSCIGERDGRIVAYGVLMLGPGEAQLLNLSVVADAQREGIGRALLRRFLADARRFGARQMFLEVRPSNAKAIALYDSEGFSRIARRTGYYPAGPDGEREDALVMRCALLPGPLPDLAWE